MPYARTWTLSLILSTYLSMSVPAWVNAQVSKTNRLNSIPDYQTRAEALSEIAISPGEEEEIFSGEWALSKEFHAAYVSWRAIETFKGSWQLNQRELTRDFSDDYDLDEFYVLEAEFSKSFNTGAIAHQTSVTLALNKNPFSLSGRGTDALGDRFNSRQIPSPFSPTDFVSPNNSVELTLEYELALGDRLSLSVEGEVDLEIPDTNPELPTFTLSESAPFTPEITISYQLARSLWLYGTYSQSSEGIAGSNFNGEPFQPESERELEVGIETEFLDGKMSGSVSVNQTTQKHVTTTDPDRPDFQTQVDEEQTRSLTWQLIGEILPGWDLNAYYTYADGRITQDGRFLVGNQIENVARHSAGIWTTYEIQHGSWRGLGLGGGLLFVGDRAGDRDNTYKLPGYLQTDLVFFYHGQNCQAALNFQNLFNVDNVEAQPLTVLGTLLFEF